ncbi:hypothetical protein SAMN05660493_01793 [Epilithonimonas bovis DSM 19482]|uniref:Uncharacterized protein n=2 Tax=Chryseobacterium group TaxID=2782232 RepID=A0A376EC75_CHRCU|nr:hypothetical protein SAMN05660493_01793 [Epilithonimonas bovis DSM 19482]STD06752.1 Uncharacterised protein [Chryseobacterium carnipullorum]
MYLLFNYSMKSTDYIAYTLDRFPKRYVFTYDDFSNEVKKICKFTKLQIYSIN